MIRLFHVSDVHFGAEDVQAIAWFNALVRDEAPDAIIMTGDLTMRARAAEFDAAAKWLVSLDRPVTVEVGNHDLPYFNPFARFVAPYRRYLALERMIERSLDIHGVSVVPLRTTARFQWRLNWSKGRVSTRELQKSLALVEAAPKDGLTLLACHHPLIEAGTHASAKTRRGAAALSALATAGIDAVLTGHVHDPFDIHHQVGGRTVRLIGAGTLSCRTRDTRPGFNELRIEGRELEVVQRAMD